MLLVILTENVKNLQNLLDRISVAGQQASLSINIKKMKLIVFSQRTDEDATLQLNGEKIERVL